MAQRLADKLCELATELWPEEWAGKFTATQKELRDWLNEKTQLDVCHITHYSAPEIPCTKSHANAILAWIITMEEIKNAAEHPA
jgi:hypothetical protein